MLIDKLLEEDSGKDLLRLATAGSVDDGKSTLIGRLLFESKGIYEDQLDAIEKASEKLGTTGGQIDLALVTDGLKAEREQGITIDVAYRYFSTPKRKFIIADSPGHEQYTRNMVTGSSTASLMIVLIDASKGVVVQSRRHAFIGSLLRVPHILVAINKMDLVDYSQEIFENITRDFTEFATKLELTDLSFVPVSALEGDNVVETSSRMPWYQGRSLLGHLENVHIASDRNLIDLRLPVQYVSRPDSRFRGYMGMVASGAVRSGDEVVVLPSGVSNVVESVHGPSGPLEQGHAGQSLTVTLRDEVDISRGDMIVHRHNQPSVERAFEAMVVWMANDGLRPGQGYLLKHGGRQIPATVDELRYRVDVNTLHREQSPGLGLNEIGRCVLTVHQPLAFDPYRRNRTTGSFILIDRTTNNTVGAGMILGSVQAQSESLHGRWQKEPLSKVTPGVVSSVALEERERRQKHRALTIFLTGLSGSRKADIAYQLERELFRLGHQVMVLDGRKLRAGIGRDLGFTAGGRDELMRRASEMAKLINDAGLIVICSFVAPDADVRRRACKMIGTERFVEVHVDAPINYCRANDPGGLYPRADVGELKHFPGVSADYDRPESPALTLKPAESSVEDCVDRLLALLETKDALIRS